MLLMIFRESSEESSVLDCCGGPLSREDPESKEVVPESL